MRLIDVFGVKSGDVIALVGGGGKTTTMFRLAEELAAQGKRVVTTTTTRIFAAQIQLAPQHVFVENAEQGMRDIEEALGRASNVLAVGATDAEGKAFGVEPSFVDALAARDDVDVVIVEADGSRMRPFKAPGAHEPVIPGSTTLLVPVVGIDVLGKVLDDEHVHRAAVAAELAGIPLGTVLTAEHIARVLGAAAGGLKNRPPHARVIPLVNKVAREAEGAAAREIAGRLLKLDEIDAVALGAVRNQDTPILEGQRRVAGILLAAGGSTRMGANIKQLMAWGDTTLAANAAATAAQADLAELVVVTGNRAEEVKAQVAAVGVQVVFNPDWQSGRASSVRAGIRALRENTAAAIFINVDQPFLTPDVIRQVVNRFAETHAPIVVPVYDSKTGSPALFTRSMFAELEALEGEQGGRELLQLHRAKVERVDIADVRAGMDVDTFEEYVKAKSLM